MDPLRPANLEANVQIGDFRIERRIGAGGMGIVYLARQVSLNRPVALKVMGPALHLQADITRFQREAQAVAKLKHPMIAAVHYVGQDQQLCYLVMEYVDGDSLRIVMNRLRAVRDPKLPLTSLLQLKQEDGGEAREMRFDIPTGMDVTPAPLDETQADQDSLSAEARQLIESKDYIRWCCKIVWDAAQALDHAHKQGVIHRDIKPENLLLDRQGQVHVIDFGLARFFEDVTVTHSGALIGTPAYMSPEQVTGRVTVDHRTDTYSLGLVLYELLTLRRPIQAPTREGILRQVVTKALPPVSLRNRGVPRDLEGVIHKATAKDPDERYQKTSDFGNDLQSYLNGKRVIAVPYRFKLDRREIAAERPWAITLIAYSILSLLFLTTANTINLVLNNYYMRSSYELLILVPLWSLAFLSFGLLRGRIWSLWLTTLLISLITLGITYSLVSDLYLKYTLSLMGNLDWVGLRGIGTVPTFVIPNYASSIIFLTLIIILLIQIVGHNSRNWFRFAQRLGSEHKRLRRSSLQQSNSGPPAA